MFSVERSPERYVAVGYEGSENKQGNYMPVCVWQSVGHRGVDILW